jgi:hypothetical protein
MAEAGIPLMFRHVVGAAGGYDGRDGGVSGKTPFAAFGSSYGIIGIV